MRVFLSDRTLTPPLSSATLVCLYPDAEGLGVTTVIRRPCRQTRARSSQRGRSDRPPCFHAGEAAAALPQSGGGQLTGFSFQPRSLLCSAWVDFFFSLFFSFFRRVHPSGECVRTSYLSERMCSRWLCACLSGTVDNRVGSCCFGDKYCRGVKHHAGKVERNTGAVSCYYYFFFTPLPAPHGPPYLILSPHSHRSRQYNPCASQNER